MTRIESQESRSFGALWTALDLDCVAGSFFVAKREKAGAGSVNNFPSLQSSSRSAKTKPQPKKKNKTKNASYAGYPQFRVIFKSHVNSTWF